MQTMSDLTVTILMPCLNEAETLAFCVRQAVAALRDNNVAGEVLIADNGSTNGSKKIATEKGARVVPVPVGGRAQTRGPPPPPPPPRQPRPQLHRPPLL